MRNKIFIAVFIVMGFCGFSQAAVDIFDPLYEDIRIWEKIGLLNDTSSLRPYPLQEIERILNIVIEKGTEKQIKKAQEYKKRLFGRVFHYGGEAELGIKIPKKQRDISIAPLLDMNISIHKLLTASAHVNFSLLNKLPKEEGKPAFQFSKKDIFPDDSVVGSFTLLPMFNSGIAVGTPEYYLSAGMARTSFGPFDENNILIGEQAFHSGQFIFVVNKEKFTYNQTLLAISASDDRGGGSYSPKKFAAAHSITYRPLPWISVGLVDIITYGDRFEPIYLLPFSVFFIGQSIYNFADASMLGITLTVKPIKGLKIDVVLLADDLGFNEIIKFKDARWRIAGQFGVSYAIPKDHWFSFADINYTLVTPYCYTSINNNDRKEPNYENYTHNGEPLGSNLPPNSDRIRVKAQFTPLEGLSINVSNTFIRHANVTESVYDPAILREYLKEGNYSTDGSVFNHSAVVDKNSERTNAFRYATPFLTQQTIQYINQLGLEGVVNLPILKSGGSMQFKIGYTFEANINPGVNRNIYDRATDMTSLTTDAKILEAANKKLKEWREKAVGKEFNHYFNIGVKISY